MSSKITLVIGTTLLYFSAITPVEAVNVSSWAELNTNKAATEITLIGDIQAEGSPSVISLGMSGKVKIEEDQVIDGAGNAITGASGYSFTLNNNADVTLENLGSFSAGSASDNTFSYIDLNGDTVYTKIIKSVNAFPAYFATRYQADTTLNVDNSVFTSNGGRIFVLDKNTETLNVTNSIFSNNTSNQNIAMISGSGTINIENSVFYNNSNLNRDGGVLKGSGNISIINSYFIENSAGDDGGVISLTGASYSSIEGSKFERNISDGDGGAIALETNNHQVRYIKDSEFIGNQSSPYNDGGAISTMGGYIKTIENVLFENNNAGIRGGGLWAGMASKHKEKDPVLIKDTIFKNNEAGAAAGMFTEGNRINTTYITSSQFIDNTAKQPGHYMWYTNPLGGGLMSAGGVPMVLNDVIFSGNQAIPRASTNYSAGGAMYFAGDTAEYPLQIIDSTFTNNSAFEGGALFVDNADTAIIATSNDVVFSENTSGADSDDYNGGSDIYFQNTSYAGTLSLNADANKKIVFNGSIASYYEDDAMIPNIEINKSGITYNTYDGTTETAVTAGTGGEVQFKGRVGDDNYRFNVNFYDGTLVVTEGAVLNASLNGSDGTVNIDGQLNIANSASTAKTITFGQNSTLQLMVNSLTDYGSLTAETITIVEGAKLNATLAQGIVEKGKSATLQLLSANNADFNNFIDSFDNNIYHFEKADLNGLYTITSKGNSPEDVVEENGGQAWVAEAAEAYLDSAMFAEGSVAADIANKLNVLLQNDALALISEIKALAPTEAAVVQDKSITNISQLFRTVDNHLQGRVEPEGMSAGDAFSDVTIWAKPYVGKTKVSRRGEIAKQKSKNLGVIVAIEKKMTPDVKLGTGLHYDEMDVDILKRDIEAKTLAGFMYTEYKPNDWFVNTMASYAYSDYDENKFVLGSAYNASYDVHTGSLATMTGYQLGDFTPEIGLQYYHIERTGYEDTATQYVHKLNANYMRATGGVRFAKNYNIFCPDIYLGLSYDILSPDNDTTVSLANGTSYIVDGERLPRLGYELNASLNTYLTDNVTLGVSYFGSYRKNYQEHSGMLKLKYDF